MYTTDGNPFEEYEANMVQNQNTAQPEVIDTVAVEIVGKPAISALNEPVEYLTEDIAIIGATQNLQVTSDFQAALNTIQPAVNKANSLLQLDINNVDDDEIANNLRELKEAQDMVKNINAARKAVKKYYDNIRDENIQQLDNMLESAGYGQLVGIDKDIKKLKNDVSANRINHRWNELKATFDANVNQYEIITRLAPKLADYGNFRITHDKLISGAKTAKISDKHRKIVNDEMFSYHEVLTEIEKNDFGLNEHYKMVLIQDFIKSPSKATVFERTKYYLERQKVEKEAEERRKLVEKQREIDRIEQARLQKEMEEQQILSAKSPAPASPQQLTSNNTLPQRDTAIPQNYTMFTQTKDFDRPQATDKYPWLTEYIFRHPKLRNISNDNRAKSNLLYQMFNSFGDPNSVFVRETKMNPDLITKITQHILDM